MWSYDTFTLASLTREKCLHAARYFASKEGTCFLYSGGCLDSAQTSYLGLFPFETLSIQLNQVSDPWQILKGFFGNQHPLDYAFGFIGYEMGAFSDFEKRLPYQEAQTPDAYWQRCAVVLIVDHRENKGTVIIAKDALASLDLEKRKWGEPAAWHQLLANFSDERFQKFYSPLRLVDIPSRQESYFSKIEAILEWIRSGDIYQVNLSQPFLFEGKRDPFEVFLQMAHLNPAPFSAYFKLNSFAIVSTSPERFLQKKGNRLETRPIKGTMARGKDKEADEQQRQALLNSPKERAELLMITDLTRNDLGKISRTGSVEVDHIWHCEAYTNVFHLLSIIHSQAQPHLHPIDIIRSCFPGGSITGCPKLRAMEIIYELEQKPRGIYTGSIGYITGAGDFDLNIAIRTLICWPQLIQLQLGGGIVIDSNRDKEYQETLDKGMSLFHVLQVSI